MAQERTRADDEVDLQRIMNHVRAHPGQSFEEAEIKQETGVAKGRVRRPGYRPEQARSGRRLLQPAGHLDWQRRVSALISA